jgi:Domain of unknown function (DUF2935)
MPRKTEQSLQVTRRALLVGGGATLVGVTLLGSAGHTAWGQGGTPAGVVPQDEFVKPVILPPRGSTDLVVHTRAENLFWLDVMMEHALFFVLLMPGPELAAQRAEAKQFQATFARRFKEARTAPLNRRHVKAFNRATIELVLPFVEFKQRMREAQASGQIRSFVWPLFFDHTAREGEHFIQRLTQLSGGDLEQDRNEVVEFWTRIMFDHARFIAHLLDPDEEALIAQASDLAGTFRELHKTQPPPSDGDPVFEAAHEIVDFKTAAEQGIEAGQIRSIIHPTLADHVRREAVKFVDDLKRAP